KLCVLRSEIEDKYVVLHVQKYFYFFDCKNHFSSICYGVPLPALRPRRPGRAIRFHLFVILRIVNFIHPYNKKDVRCYRSRNPLNSSRVNTNIMEAELKVPENLLPYDGITLYYGPVIGYAKATEQFEVLLRDIEWKNDEAKIFGKHFITKRKAAWYGDRPFEYTYSKTTKRALPWTPELLDIKTTVEKLSATTFNSCLLNLYHSGDEGMSWHSDDEKILGKDTTIASVSLGTERKFSLKHKTSKETV